MRTHPAAVARPPPKTLPEAEAWMEGAANVVVALVRTDRGEESDKEADVCTDYGGEVDDLACDGKASKEAPTREGGKGGWRTSEVARTSLPKNRVNRQLSGCMEVSTCVNAAVEGTFGASAKWLRASNRSGPEVIDVGETSALRDGIPFGNCGYKELLF